MLLVSLKMIDNLVNVVKDQKCGTYQWFYTCQEKEHFIIYYQCAVKGSTLIPIWYR